MPATITDSADNPRRSPAPVTDPQQPVIASGVTDDRLKNLRIWNLGLAALHAVQAVLIVVLAGDFAIQVVSTFPEGPPGTRVPAADDLFAVRIGVAIAVFLALAAIDHLVTATVARATYEADLRRGINRFRWVEYSFSATLMVILIAFYSGITNITTVIAVAGANVAMILFGWVQERVNPPGRAETTMLPFWFGTIAGIAPWVAIAVQIIGSETVPGFVYGIVVVQFVLFFSFGLNQWLQYRQIGPWTDYVYGEKAYLVLSLAAKSLLAWQIYFPSLD
jgi:VanZ family protein